MPSGKAPNKRQTRLEKFDSDKRSNFSGLFAITLSNWAREFFKQIFILDLLEVYLLMCTKCEGAAGTPLSQASM